MAGFLFRAQAAVTSPPSLSLLQVIMSPQAPTTPPPETSENVQRDLAPGVSSLCQSNGKRTLRAGIVGLAYLSPCANLMTWAAFLSSRNPLMRIASGNPPSPPASSAWVNGVGTQPSFFTTRPRTTSDAPFSTCNVPTKKGRTGGIFVAVVVQLAVVVVVVLALTLAHKVSGQVSGD